MIMMIASYDSQLCDSDYPVIVVANSSRCIGHSIDRCSYDIWCMMLFCSDLKKCMSISTMINTGMLVCSCMSSVEQYVDAIVSPVIYCSSSYIISMYATCKLSVSIGDDSYDQACEQYSD